MSTYRGVNINLALCLNSVLNVKELVGDVVVEPMEHYTALLLRYRSLDQKMGSPCDYLIFNEAIKLVKLGKM